MQLNNLFIDEINKMLPSNEAATLIQAIECEPPVTAVRFNDGKGAFPPQQLHKVPWCSAGAYLSQRPQFTFDPLFHAGHYYVQDPSSMFIYHVIKTLVKEPVAYLDLCAAPGGKTTAALQALPTGSVLVANEIVKQRAQVLRENIIKWGAHNCLVSNDSPKSIGNLENAFDIIAADVPCSGEGMFRKDAEAVSQWSPALVDQCSQRQRQILTDVWPSLKPGGLLIYSTCTYNLHENEEIVDFVTSELGATVIGVDTHESWNIHHGIDRSYPCYRFMPNVTRGEGLFMCVMVKHQNMISNSKPKTTRATRATTPPIAASLKSWLNIECTIYQQDDRIIALPNNIKPLIQTIQNKLHIINEIGIPLATIKGKKIIPSHQLALSPNLDTACFNEAALDYATAISYLRGEAITVNAPRGHVLVKYNNAALGWVNNLATRANNLYPKSWRIMSTHTPDTYPIIMK